MKRFFELVLSYPRTTLVLFLAFTVFFASQIPRVPVETDLKKWLPEGHPEVEYYDEMRDLFNLSSRGVIGIVHEGPEGIFNPTTLKLIAHLTEEVKAMDFVIEEDVVSLATQDNIIGTAEGLEVTPFMETVPQTTEEAEALRATVHDNDMYHGTLVSKDDTATLIAIRFVEGVSAPTLCHQIRTLVEAKRALYPNDRIYYSGRPILQGILHEEIIGDMRVMLPIVVAVVIGLLAVTLRTVRGVVLPLVTVIVSAIWTLGIMALLQSPLYSMSTMIPVILTAIGCAYGIHIISRYYEAVKESVDHPRRDVVMQTMTEMWSPVLMASLTTVVGFLSMTVSRSLPPRSVGIFTALGVAVATFASFTMIPAGLVLMHRVRPGSIISRRGKPGTGLLDEVLGFWGRTVYKHKRWVFAGVILVVIGSIFGTSKMRIHEGLTANMRPGTEAIKADEFLNEKFGGTTTFNVIVEGPEPDTIKSPELLHDMDSLQAYMEQHPLVGDSISIAEYLKRMNKVMNEGQESYDRVPDDRDLIAQYLLLYSISGDPDDFDEVVDYEYQKANVSIAIKSDSGEKVADVFAKLQPEVKKLEEKNPSYKFTISGRAKMTLLVINNVIRDQLQSFVVAIIAVFLITSIMFKSVRIGLITIIPIAIASLANFGLMGLLGLPLQVATTFSACVGIGIGIDYTIHFLAKYRRVTAKGYTGAESNALTMQTSGRAIFFNAVVVAFGFLVLAWSNSPPNRNMGILVSLNMATSFIGAMTVLPCILNLVKPETVMGGPIRPNGSDN